MAGTMTWTDKHTRRSRNTHMQVHAEEQRHATIHGDVPHPRLDSVEYNARGMEWMAGGDLWDQGHGTHPKQVQAKASFGSRELI